MRRTISLTAACLTLSVVLLTGCSGAGAGAGAAGPDSTDGASPSVPGPALAPVDTVADAAALAEVSLTAEPGRPPVVDLVSPLHVTGPVARVVEPGTGEVIEANRAVVVDVVTIDGTDGTEQGSTYGGPPQILMTTEASMPAALLETVVGAQAGVRVALAGPVGEGRTTVWVFEVGSVLDVPPEAEGTPAEVDPGLPFVGFADSATTDVRMPMIAPAVGPPPEGLVVQPLIVGTGAEVTADSSLVVQVVGSLWDGTQFQSTWEESSGLPVVLSGAIRGWREGLLGQTVGSRVMLVVPPDMAWGDAGRGDLVPGGATVVFVVDVLAGVSS